MAVLRPTHIDMYTERFDADARGVEQAHRGEEEGARASHPAAREQARQVRSGLHSLCSCHLNSLISSSYVRPHVKLVAHIVASAICMAWSGLFV